MHEDFYSSVENKKQEIVSKSLWKEDTLFIKRIYDHFQKSYMSTEADRRSFFAEHGTPFWEYTMTMGFKRNQLFVPLVKNNQIIGVMRVQREDRKAFYSFTKDDEALQFFDIVMYNRNLYELQPQKDEKLNQSISSKGGYTWTCTKRIVITGYHMEGDVMVMETSALDVCKYTYTGNKPPVDHIDVYTDGMEGGGGGDEEEENSNQNIIDSLKGYPCAQSIIQQLPNLKNDIALSMRQIFQNNQDYNITFKAKTGLGTTDGVTYSNSSQEFNTFKATIYINDQILTNATKEYILVTMYHEVIHAFLSYELFRLGYTEFHNQYLSVMVGYDYAPNGTIINRFTFLPEHQEVGPFLGTLENILLSYNPNLPTATARAMAKAGITSMTPAEFQLNNNEKSTLSAGYQGTKCL